MKFHTTKLIYKREHTLRPCYLSCHISTKTFEQIENLAKQNGTSVSYEASIIIENYFNRKKEGK